MTSDDPKPITATELELRCREAWAELNRRLCALAEKDNLTKLDALTLLIEQLRKAQS